MKIRRYNHQYMKKKISVDKNFVDSLGSRKKRQDLVNKNNILIYDIITNYTLNSNTIYVTDAYVEYLFFKDVKRIKISNKLINGYF